MPIFGNRDGELNYGVTIEDCSRGSVFTCPENGYGTSISVRIRNRAAGLPQTMACAIYKVVGEQGELLAYSGEYTIPPVSGEYLEYTFDLLSYPQLLAGAEYLLVAWAEGHLAMGATQTPGFYARQDCQGGYHYPTWHNPHKMLQYLEIECLIWCTYSVGDPNCINPTGWKGDVMCGSPEYGQNPTHLYECQCVPGGSCEWVDLGYSADCDIPENCIAPQGEHGAVMCGNPDYGQDPTHRYECINGEWVDLGYFFDCVKPTEIPFIPVILGVALCISVVVAMLAKG
jgi:hypothetical protein